MTSLSTNQQVVVIPDCKSGPSHQAAGVQYLYADAFKDDLAFKTHIERILNDLKSTAQHVQIPAGSFEDVACLLTGLHSMRVFRGVAGFQGIIYATSCHFPPINYI